MEYSPDELMEKLVGAMENALEKIRWQDQQINDLIKQIVDLQKRVHILELLTEVKGNA